MIKLVDLLKENYSFSRPNIDKDEEGIISVEYTFSTKNNKYRVVFNGMEEPRVFEVEFGVDKGELYALDTLQMTGEGNALKIFNTITEIINSFLQTFPNDYDKVVITGTTDKRRNVYRKFFPSKINPKYSDKVIIK